MPPGLAPVALMRLCRSETALAFASPAGPSWGEASGDTRRVGLAAVLAVLGDLIGNAECGAFGDLIREMLGQHRLPDFPRYAAAEDIRRVGRQHGFHEGLDQEGFEFGIGVGRALGRRALRRFRCLGRGSKRLRVEDRPECSARGDRDASGKVPASAPVRLAPSIAARMRQLRSRRAQLLRIGGVRNTEDDVRWRVDGQGCTHLCRIDLEPSFVRIDPERALSSVRA